MHGTKLMTQHGTQESKERKGGPEEKGHSGGQTREEITQDYAKRIEGMMTPAQSNKNPMPRPATREAGETQDKE